MERQNINFIRLQTFKFEESEWNGAYEWKRKESVCLNPNMITRISKERVSRKDLIRIHMASENYVVRLGELLEKTDITIDGENKKDI